MTPVEIVFIVMILTFVDTILASGCLPLPCQKKEVFIRQCFASDIQWKELSQKQNSAGKKILYLPRLLSQTLLTLLLLFLLLSPSSLN